MADTIAPRVERGRRTNLWVPHNGGERAFAYPSVSPGTYRNIGNAILKNGQLVPTGDYTADLLHPAYCRPEVADEPEFQNVRGTMKNGWLYVFNINLWTKKEIYVIQDSEARGISQQLNQKDLEEMLKDGREVNGIRFSKDGRVRSAPRESHRPGKHTSESFARDGFVIASYGIEGAEKFGEISSALGNQAHILGAKANAQGQTVSMLGESIGGLYFLCNWKGSRYGFAYAALK